MKPQVSLAMIVKDEAETLGCCLESIAGLVDEAVVVDTGSADATRDVARRYGAVVHEFAWTDSFAAARNESLRHATGEWVFWLDADEWLDDANRDRLRSLVDRLGDENAVYFMRQASPLRETRSGELSVSQPRLFRNTPPVRWRYRAHEQILPACLERGDRPTATDLVIHHSGYELAEATQRKEGRNRALLLKERAENPADPWVLYQLARLDLGESFESARAALTEVLRLTRPGDPLRRPALALLARGLVLHGETGEAVRLLREGLALFPNDTNLLSEWGLLAAESGDSREAEAAFRNLLSTPADLDELFGPVDLSLRGWQTRHHLAVVCLKQGRAAEAETHGRAAVAENPGCAPAWTALAEALLAQGRWDDFDAVLARIGADGDEDATLLRGRSLVMRGELISARELLAAAAERHPRSVPLRLLLSLACLKAGDDPDTAERVLREILEIDPKHIEARRTLAALLEAFDDADDDDDGEEPGAARA
jgi:Flp pilus assembly protein TadD